MEGEDDDNVQGIAGEPNAEANEGGDAGDEIEGADASLEEDASEEESNQETEVLSQPKAARGNRDFGALRAKNREQEERLARIAQELEDLKRAQAEASRPRVDPELERRRYEAMSPEERIEYRLGQIQHESQRSAHQVQMQMWDVNDRSQFSAIATADPEVGKIAAEVEKIFQDNLRQGKPTDRLTITDWLDGRNRRLARANGKKATKAAALAGKQNLARQKTRPLNGRGDAGAERGGKSLDDRLEGVII